MNILFVGRNCQVGGGSTFRYRASLGLLPRGHNLTLAAQAGAMVPMFQALGVKFVRVPPSPLNVPFLIALMRRGRFDLVHAVTPTAGDDVFRALRFVPAAQKPAFVLSIHGVLPAVVQRASQNPCLLAADELICFDAFALKRLRSIAGLETRPIHRVPRPVEARKMPVEAKNSEKPPQMVMVSRLSKSKGKTALSALEAVENLAPRFPDLRLEIIGDGTLHPEIGRRCAALNARLGREAARAPGFSVDPFPAMAQAAGVIGTAYVALEALFHAIPVVAAGYEGFGVVDEANLDEAIACNFGDGYPGVQPEVTPAFLGAGFERVLLHFASPAGRDELARMQARVQADHAVEAVGARLEAIYQSALALHRGGATSA